MVEVWTHRGLGFGDENALGAYRNAVKHGIKKLETDVGSSLYRTKYLLHDDTLDRTTNGRGLLWETPDEILDTLTLDRNPLADKPEPLPRLEKFLDEFGQDEEIVFDLDLKLQMGIGPEVHEIVAARDLVPRVLFSSRDLRTLQAIKSKDSDATVGLVVHDCNPRKVPKIAKAGVDVLKPHTGITTRALLNACHDNDMRLHTWIYGTRTRWDRAMRRRVHDMLNLDVDAMYMNTPFQIMDLVRGREQLVDAAPLRPAA